MKLSIIPTEGKKTGHSEADSRAGSQTGANKVKENVQLRYFSQIFVTIDAENYCILAFLHDFTHRCRIAFKQLRELCIWL